MKTTSVSYAKAHLSALLRRVRAGQEIVITDRGTPVARLIPAHAGALGESVSALVARGLVAPPRVPPTARRIREIPNPPKAPRGVSLLQTLLEEREEGR